MRKLGGSLTVTAPSVEARGRALDLDEIEALLCPAECRPPEGDRAEPEPAEQTTTDPAAGPLDREHAVPPPEGLPGALEGPRRYQFKPIDGDADRCAALDRVENIELALTIELGRTQLALPRARARNGSVIALEQSPEDPVDLLVNGRRIARGEVLVLDDKFCVRITELTPGPAGQSDPEKSNHANQEARTTTHQHAEQEERISADLR